MKVGFTGTRDGMTDAQYVSFRQWFADSGATEFHHGCCSGADAVAGVRVYDSYPFVRVVGHPSDLKAMTETEAVAKCHELHGPKPPLDRNRDIVDACEVLVACPKSRTEERRSGTWATIRYARRQKRRIVFVWPDGGISEESGS